MNLSIHTPTTPPISPYSEFNPFDPEFRSALQNRGLQRQLSSGMRADMLASNPASTSLIIPRKNDSTVHQQTTNRSNQNQVRHITIHSPSLVLNGFKGTVNADETDGVEVRDIESDGPEENSTITSTGLRLYNPDSTPPTDETRAIPGLNSPENTNRCIFRMGTFQHFPEEVSVECATLAEYGFFYTGYQDLTQCFDCNIRHHGWAQNKTPLNSRQLHYISCNLAHNRETSNDTFPLTEHPQFVDEAYLTPESYRSLATSTYALFSSAPVPPSISASVTAAQEIQDAWSMPQYRSRQQPHPSHSQVQPLQRPLREEANRLSFATANRNESAAHSSAENIELFPCDSPARADMRELQSRIETYPTTRQNTHSCQPFPTQVYLKLAEAGFFYNAYKAGRNNDAVSCWYCAGGLQNWKEEELRSPWQEHAKYYHNCEFLLQQKGFEYVAEVASTFPYIQRPNQQPLGTERQHNQQIEPAVVQQVATLIPNINQPGLPGHVSNRVQVSHGTPSTGAVLMNGGTSFPNGQIRPHEATEPRIVDPRQEKNNIITGWLKHECAHNAQGIVCNDKALKDALTQKITAQTTVHSPFPYNSVSELVGVILDSQIEEEPTPEPYTQNSAAPPLDQTAGTSAYATTPRHQSNEPAASNPQGLGLTHFCKMCKKLLPTESTLFLPCGHNTACWGCGKNAKKCPTCRETVSESMRVFLS